MRQNASLSALVGVRVHGTERRPAYLISLSAGVASRVAEVATQEPHLHRGEGSHASCDDLRGGIAAHLWRLMSFVCGNKGSYVCSEAPRPTAITGQCPVVNGEVVNGREGGAISCALIRVRGGLEPCQSGHIDDAVPAVPRVRLCRGGHG